MHRSFFLRILSLCRRLALCPFDRDSVKPQLSERGAIPRIFLSYRRQDSSGHAGRLYDALARSVRGEQCLHGHRRNRCGDPISPGNRHRDRLLQCAHRAHQDQDGCRQQTRTESDGWTIRTIYVQDRARERSRAQDPRGRPGMRAGGGGIPAPDDLPATLAPLARRQGIELRDVAWHEDVTRLIRQLAASREGTEATEIATAKAEPREGTAARSAPKRRTLAALLAVAVIGSGVVLAAMLGGRSESYTTAGLDACGRRRCEHGVEAGCGEGEGVQGELPRRQDGTAGRSGLHDLAGAGRRQRRESAEVAADGAPRTGDSPNYFGSNAYRLLVNGVPRAPDKWPSDVVEARSAKEGEVEFVFPRIPAASSSSSVPTRQSGSPSHSNPRRHPRLVRPLGVGRCEHGVEAGCGEGDGVQGELPRRQDGTAGRSGLHDLAGAGRRQRRESAEVAADGAPPAPGTPPTTSEATRTGFSSTGCPEHLTNGLVMSSRPGARKRARSSSSSPRIPAASSSSSVPTRQSGSPSHSNPRRHPRLVRPLGGRAVRARCRSRLRRG